MKIKNLLQHLESVAPPSYQESYDNAGLIVGNADAEITGVLLCLDSTEAVIDEAIANNCNLVIAHHPIVFRGLKRLTGRNYVERVVMKAIKQDVAIYAIHTNLDNVYRQGVNTKIADKLGLVNTRILAPKSEVKKIAATLPGHAAGELSVALQEAGADTVFLSGRPDNQTRVEIVFPGATQGAILAVLQNKYGRQLVYEQSSLENAHPQIGAGMIGELEKPLSEADFLRLLQRQMKTDCIKYTALLGRPIKTVAVCGGSGGFLLGNAIARGADVFVTADYKYHEFFDADGKIVIADIGHYESEQFTIDLLYEIISEEFSNFAVRCTKVNTNPVEYWVQST